MSSTRQDRRKKWEKRARKSDDYWLLWVAAGFITAAAVHHAMI